MNRLAPRYSCGTLPLIGTSNSSMPVSRMMVVCTSPTATYGSSLPIINSIGRTGVVISSSRLPRSRSRTRDTAVKITIVRLRITPINAGTICTAVRRSGLYSVNTSRVRGLAGSRVTGFPTRRPGRLGCGRFISARSGSAIPGDEPSTISCAIGRLPSIRRRSKSGGMYRPAEIRPAASRARSCSGPAAVCTKSTTCPACRSCTRAREAEVWAASATAAGRWRTSMLIP